MNKVRVFITDDSVVYRSQIKIALSQLPWIEIVGAASNGKIALEFLKTTVVDLLILDLEMPEMNGIETLKELTSRGIKCKVLVFSSASKRGAEITMEALRQGASDFIPKPGPNDSSDSPQSNSDPSKKVLALMQPKIEALFPNLEIKKVQSLVSNSAFQKLDWELFNPLVIVIGSSTGGPTVLESIFSKVAGPLKIPILITQHMPPIFTAALAERIQKISNIKTVEAVNGQKVEANTIYVAPGNFHMKLMGSKDHMTIVLNQEPQINSVRPAVDPLFEDAARIFKNRCLGIVLTGMGADGKNGAIKVKEGGGAVLIQNEASCVVFGMPGAVMSAGAFDRVLDPNQIIDAINEKASLNSNKVLQTNITRGS